MKKPALIILAILLFIFYNYGLYRWIQSGHDFRDTWRAARSDWFLAVTLFDTCLFALLCLIWLIRDMTRRRCSTVQIVLLVLACLISGVVPLLVYLAYRRPPRQAQ